jgi:hypothetical protein
MPSIATLQSNTTCDIYRNGHAPPAAPDVAGVAIYLTPDYAMGREHNESDQTHAWTHLMVCGAAIDVRDGFTLGSSSDFAYVPNKNGTKFSVIKVVRRNRNSSNDLKVVYLQRQTPTWPTNNL